MSHDALQNLANTFFNAIEAADIPTLKSCFSPNAEIWHNTDELIVSPEQTAQILAGMHTRIKNVVYTNRRFYAFPGGFVQQHVLEGNRIHDGVKVRLPCALVCLVESGKIVRLDEYFDSRHQETFRKYAPKI